MWQSWSGSCFYLEDYNILAQFYVKDPQFEIGKLQITDTVEEVTPKHYKAMKYLPSKASVTPTKWTFFALFHYLSKSNL